MTPARTEHHQHLVERYYHELWNAWRFELAGELIHPRITFLGSLGTQVRGRGQFLEYMQAVRAAFPDFRNTIEEMIAEGDAVAARLTYTGTHRGALFGIAPTGRAVTYQGAAIFRFEADQIVHGWVLGDRWGLREQLGR